MSDINRRLAALERKRDVAAGLPKLDTPTNVIDFATNPRFLGLNLFPRQATLLKILTLMIGLMTAFDWGVIREWQSSYSIVDDFNGRYWGGERGTAGNLRERIEHCLRKGRTGFREVVLAMGRRGSKSLLTAILILWSVYRLLALDDPQEHYRLPAGKRIVLFVFSTTKSSASRDLFGDIVSLLRNSPCLAPFIEVANSDEVRLYTPAQLRRGAHRRGEHGLIVISASPTTASTARGPAAYSVTIDEAAHVGGAGATSSADEVRRAASPALAQFGGEGTLMMPSTPWSMQGAFYESFRQGNAVEHGTDDSLDLEVLTLQLPSEELYKDHDRATSLEMWPGGPVFRDPGPPKVDSDFLDSERRRDPRSFDTEFGAQFMSGRQAYFEPHTLAKLFGPHRGQVLENRILREKGIEYFFHCDPGTSGSNFALVIGHVEVIVGHRHVVIDVYDLWRAADFLLGRVDYNVVLEKLIAYARLFKPKAIYHDNFNTAFFADRLQPALREAFLTATVHLVTHTQIEKFRRYEDFKTRANLGEVHAPPHPLAVMEARFIEQNGLEIRHPTSGPCRTDDLIDASTWMVWHLANSAGNVADQFSEVRAHASRLDELFDRFRSDRSSYGPIVGSSFVPRPGRRRF